MSDCKSLVCDNCRAAIWIGQNRYAGGHLVLYTEAADVMEHLRLFLDRHEGHGLRFVGDAAGDIAEYADEGPEDEKEAGAAREDSAG
jgi:hypothetical protein